MKKNMKAKVAAIVGVLLVCFYGIFGIPKGVTGQALLNSLTDHIHLGLDLQGGAHLILQVVVKDAVNAETDNTVARLQQDLATNHFQGTPIKLDPNNPQVVEITGVDPSKAGDLRNVLSDKYGAEYDITGPGANKTMTLTMKPTQVTDLENRTVEQSIETIRDRVDKLGVSEPKVEPYGLGQYQILVELPGVSDEDRVKDTISSTSQLSVHEVAGDSAGYASEQEALTSLGGTIPPDEELLRGNAQGDTSNDRYFLLKRLSIVGGKDFRDASAIGVNDRGTQGVNFVLTNSGGDRFYDYTSSHVGSYMAIVLGDTVKNVAVIKGAIRDQGQIEGSFTKEQIDALSFTLRTGALPATINYIEERSVGASLGADSIREGVTAAVAGMLAVMIFMLIYYRGAGINADVALFLNLVILLGFMGYSNSVLTLPGIAGVILTIGMGVDSNVLIFERIREELRAGKGAAQAIDLGFAHAWITIVDTHVTTIVSAAILFLFGTGPVKGFATTLTFGLLANLFTAVFVSRVIFDSHVDPKAVGQKVSI
ncbi:protein translocase subunit SecD [Acidicapsa dinghuensis]|uniref:Protein translocase subunit SecD n=1 Tax=Acidicapsa dinghuensis TaxID=2218256 RepID=A0ABW1EA51_9BACT|nr:protein translocase subunit SecD [Acidicapsa dinghuensis]